MDVLKIIVLVNWMAASSGLLNDTTLAVWRHIVFVFILFFSGVDGQQKRPLDGVVTVHESLAWITKCQQKQH